MMTKINSFNHLTQDDFLNLVDKAKLISIDIVLRTTDGAILKGKRRNSPAKEKWFVPGGRIRKGETIREALHRILEDELGIDSLELQGIFSGPYDHFYPNENVMNASGIDTEYVVLGYHANVSRDYISLENLPKEQHIKWAWLRDQSSEVVDIHKKSYRYFEFSKHVLNQHLSLLDSQDCEASSRWIDRFSQLP